jgi:hypothetical protein
MLFKKRHAVFSAPAENDAEKRLGRNIALEFQP